jgi:hypothetical protein
MMHIVRWRRAGGDLVCRWLYGIWVVMGIWKAMLRIWKRDGWMTRNRDVVKRDISCLKETMECRFWPVMRACVLDGIN